MASTTPHPLDVFHSFPHLPIELRLRIWKLHLLALPSRILTITRKIQHFSSSEPVPALLHTCLESYVEARGFYARAFFSGCRSDPRFIWTNWNSDIINIDDKDLSKVDFKDKVCIQEMIVGTYDRYDFHRSESDFDPMGMLRRLEIHSTENLYDWYGVIGEMKEEFRERFKYLPGYVCPEIKIVQKGTLWEMNVHNERAIRESETLQMRRARRRLRGVERRFQMSGVGNIPIFSPPGPR